MAYVWLFPSLKFVEFERSQEAPLKKREVVTLTTMREREINGRIISTLFTKTRILGFAKPCAIYNDDQEIVKKNMRDDICKLSISLFHTCFFAYDREAGERIVKHTLRRRNSASSCDLFRRIFANVMGHMPAAL